MAIANVNGVSLFYEEKGTGAPVVFVHGTISDPRAWNAQVDALSSKYHTVVYSRRYAHPNARQGDLMDSTVQNNAADLEALLRQLGVAPAHIVGHSYGGHIAAFLALEHPELLKSLTLVNAAVATLVAKDTGVVSTLSILFRSPGIVPSVMRFMNGLRTTIKEVDAGDPSAATRIFIPALQDGRTDLPAKPGDFDKMVLDNARTLKEVTTPLPPITRAEARRITTPTLVIWGEHSAPWDTKISRTLVESIPGSEAAEIPGAGHFCLGEKPKEVNEALMNFLQKHR